jgi:large exoprotein involved in heme utilization and adhesion
MRPNYSGCHPGAERSSVVTPNVVSNGLPSDRIDGGAIRSSNLFHSFVQFNVDAGRAAYFTNPAGIKNILSRVTGGSRSEILGSLVFWAMPTCF